MLQSLFKGLLKTAGPVPAAVRRLADSPAAPGSVKKADDEMQIVWGEVYAPGFPDSQGDYMTAEDIRQMASRFMQKSDMHEIDVQHDEVKSGAFVVESFIAREGDPTFIPHAWVLGVHIPDATLWSAVKKGELSGFSLDGFGVREPTELTIEMPEMLKGRTLKSEDADHEHDFYVRYAEDGTFLGGRTNEVNGHHHEILRGTCTEFAGSPKHDHRFSYIEGVLNA